MSFMAADFPLDRERGTGASRLFDLAQSLRRNGEDALDAARRVIATEAVRRARGRQNAAAALIGVSIRRMHWLCRGGRSGPRERVPAIVDPDLLPPAIIQRRRRP